MWLECVKSFLLTAKCCVKTASLLKTVTEQHWVSLQLTDASVKDKNSIKIDDFYVGCEAKAAQ